MSGKPAASAVIMVRPAHFCANPETAASNRFQARADTPETLARSAREEFDAAVDVLVRHAVDVHVFEGNDTTVLPDEVFANNWISTHPGGEIVLYPMLAPNRRRERRHDIVQWLRGESGSRCAGVVDLTALEERGAFLEGTGSLVIDHAGRRAYACLSPRTTVAAVAAWSAALAMPTQTFAAADGAGAAIYHTNVMLALTPAVAVVCLEALTADDERQALTASLEAGGREILAITQAQMAAFAANVLALESRTGPVIALSQQALDAYTPSERRRLERHATLAVCAIPNIETFGGGSLRCMLTENWLSGA
jgi:hypothetical protein